MNTWVRLGQVFFDFLLFFNLLSGSGEVSHLPKLLLYSLSFDHLVGEAFLELADIDLGALVPLRASYCRLSIIVIIVLQGCGLHASGWNIIRICPSLYLGHRACASLDAPRSLAWVKHIVVGKTLLLLGSRILLILVVTGPSIPPAARAEAVITVPFVSGPLWRERNPLVRILSPTPWSVYRPWSIVVRFGCACLWWPVAALVIECFFILPIWQLIVIHVFIYSEGHRFALLSRSRRAHISFFTLFDVSVSYASSFWFLMIRLRWEPAFLWCVLLDFMLWFFSLISLILNFYYLVIFLL